MNRPATRRPARGIRLGLVPAPEVRDAVRLEGVSLAYGDVSAIDDVTLQIPTGSTVALMGPNGAGKSSLLAVVAGLVRPTAGVVVVAGERAERGVLTHNAMLYDGLTGRENLLLHARLRRIPATQVTAALEETGMLSVADRPVGVLSHGQRKRLALARVLLADPAILLLDEPFTGLDADSQARLSLLLERLRATRTVVLATHDLDRALAHADRVVRLDRGRVVADEPCMPQQGNGHQPAHMTVLPSATNQAPTTQPAGVLRTAWNVFRKDLTVELRTRSVSTAVLVLAGLLAMVLAMAFEPLAGNARAVSGILWVLVVFTALHGLVRSLDADFRDDALQGLLLTGADDAGVYLGKVASTAMLLFAVALAAVGGIAVLYATPSLLRVLPALVGVVVLAVLGLAALGVTVTVIAHHSPLGETVLPLLLLPLAIPVLLAGVESAAGLLEVGTVDTGWLRVLIFYAVGMTAASMVTFEHAVEG